MEILTQFMLLVVGMLALFAPPVVAFIYAKSHKLSLKLAIIGALGFIGVQIIHVPLVIFTQGFIGKTLLPLGDFASVILYAIYLGLLAGLFEGLGRFACMKSFFKKGELSAKGAVLFGIGWGGVEVMIFTGAGLLATLLAVQALATLTPDSFAAQLSAQGVAPEQIAAQLAQFEAQKTILDTLPFYIPLIAAYERIIVMLFHIAMAVLVYVAVKESKLALVIYAILLHSFVDAFAVAAAAFLGNAILVELALTIVIPVCCFAGLKLAIIKPKELY